MRVRLSDLEPAWLASSEYRSRMGLAFDCPMCRNHRLEAWFVRPLDGGEPVTSTVGRPLYSIEEGTELDNLWLLEALRCGEELIFVYQGEVAVT